MGQVYKESPQPQPQTVAANECDTNADTTCLGKNFVVLHYTTRTADVFPYDKAYQPIENVPIVTGATAFDDEITGQTYILIINEALYYGSKLDHSLINPNQFRAYGIPFWDNPYDKDRKLCIEATSELTIPLVTRGTKIFFRSRVPTARELATCEHIPLTATREWNPSEVTMSQLATQQTPPMFRQNESRIGSQWSYLDATNDHAILNEIDPTLVQLRERIISTMNIDENTVDVPTRRTFVSHDRHTRVTADTLAERFLSGPGQAAATLKATLQRGLRSAILPISRRYRADGMYSVKRLMGKFSAHTLWGTVRSLKGNVATQLYSHKCGFVAAYHLTKANNENIGDSLANFVHDYGAPETLTFDGAAVQVGSKTRFMDVIRRAGIRHHVSGPRRPNQNPTEAAIREVKKRWYRLLHKDNIPKQLWDYGISWVCETANVTVSSSRYADGRTPMEIITGITPDITEYLDFSFYDWVTYKTGGGVHPPELGRWLGVLHRVGALMSYWILPVSGIVISCDTVQRLTNEEKSTDAWKDRMRDFMTRLTTKFEANSAVIPRHQIQAPTKRVIDFDLEDQNFVDEYQRVIDNNLITHDDEQHVDDYGIMDPYLGIEIGLPRGDDDTLISACVKRRAVDVNGQPVGRRHDNPMFDTREYEVEFVSGEREVLAANTIAECLLSQVDEEGHRQMFMDEITNHWKTNEAIDKTEGTYTTLHGTERKKRTTRGWQLYVKWKDGSGDWVELKDLKDSYPVQLADYAVQMKLEDEPAFAWWVPYVLRKRKRIIGKLKSKYWQRTHKYGVEVPKSVQEAKRIDEKNGNTLWMDAIRLEMRNVRIAFEEFDGDVSKLVGYQQITGHLVFDVKLGKNFRRKARYCADGHKTEPPAAVTYSTVVSRDLVRIILTLAALNNFKVLGADVQNAFLTAPNLEKVWLEAGPEFGDEVGKKFIVVRALYGLKSASASFQAHMAKKLDELGFKSSVADPNVWLRAAVKPDGETYYEYTLMYVDDILVISLDPMSIMKELQKSVKFKNDKIETPSNYLGAKLQLKNINDIWCWSITSVDYVKAAVQNVEETIKKKRWRMPGKASTPMVNSYVPELDASPELDAEDVQFFQELIGMLRWATEIGRVDVLLETSLLSQYQAAPREGHLEQALHIFSYLKTKPKLSLYFDPSLPRIDYGMFKTMRNDFMEHYRDAEETMPYRMPMPRGRPITLTAFVDASHAANKKTRRSHTGYMVFLNRAPIMWYASNCGCSGSHLRKVVLLTSFVIMKVL